MIQLTRLNGHPLVVNSDLIKFVEQAPDTVLTLVSGEKVIVRENADEVLARTLEFRRAILRGMLPGLGAVMVTSAPAPSEAIADGQAER